MHLQGNSPEDEIILQFFLIGYLPGQYQSHALILPAGAKGLLKELIHFPGKRNTENPLAGVESRIQIPQQYIKIGFSAQINLQTRIWRTLPGNPWPALMAR